MAFHEYAPRPWLEILPTTPQAVRDLVSSLVRYEGSARLTAAEVTLFIISRIRTEAKISRR